jgi:hypothetical protein
MSETTSWRPPTREPDAVRATLYDYLRNRAPKIFLEEGSGTRPLGRDTLVMSNGNTLVVELSVTPLEPRTVGKRAAIVFDVAGHAAEPSTGYEVQGSIVLDRETLAFLLIEANPSVINTRR